MNKSLVKKSNSQSLLTQLITQNSLVNSIQNLDSTVVGKIIQHVGLEDSGEFLMLITSEQLQEVMDQDTWSRTKPGADEKLDAPRFCTWLAVLLEVGSDFAAEKISEMDEDILTAVLSKLVMAMETDELAMMTRASENDRFTDNKYLDKILESTFNQEVEGYLVLSKDSNHWEPVSNLLMSLQKNHSDLVERVLSRIRYATLDSIDEHDGLYNLLSENDLLEDDASYEREQRRESEGFVSPANARAFLKLIVQTPLQALLNPSADEDPIAKMYFRRFKPQKVRRASSVSPELMSLLKTYGVTPESAPKLMLQAPQEAEPGIRAYLAELQQNEEELFQRKLMELNFLANILLSGHSQQLRPVEAMNLAIEICDEGLKYVRVQKPGLEEDLLALFKIGWKLRQA